MFRKFRASLVSFNVLMLCSISGPVLQAQEDPGLVMSAYSILAGRGEVVFRFNSDDIGLVGELNSFLSVERRTSGGFEAYADEAGFKKFLEYHIPFELPERGIMKKSGLESGEFPGNWDVFPSHDQYLSFMKSMADSFPQICCLDTIGVSVKGLPILAMKITDNPNLRELEPGFVYSSSIHGDETTGYIILLRLIDSLCRNYGRDTYIRSLVDNIEIWINPLANPDGTYTYNIDGELDPKRSNENGADLNRNFPSLGGNDHPDGKAWQPENIGQMNFLQSIYYVMGANLHGGVEVVNYPFDYWTDLHADDSWYRQTSLEYVSMARVNSYPYLYMYHEAYWPDGITNGFLWYKADGTRQDWINYFNHGREVTIEISEKKNPDPSEILNFWHYNYSSLLRYMEQSLFGIHGIIKDAITGDPIRAKVLVQAHDQLNSYIYSDSLTGYFARLIEPGIWDLEISASGFHSSIISDVGVSLGNATMLELSLNPLVIGTRDADGVESFRSPFVNGKEIYIPVSSPGVHRIRVYDLKGSLIFEDLRYYNSVATYHYSLEGVLPVRGVYLLKIISPESGSTLKFINSQ